MSAQETDYNFIVFCIKTDKNSYKILLYIVSLEQTLPSGRRISKQLIELVQTNAVQLHYMHTVIVETGENNRLLLLHFLLAYISSLEC